MALNGKVKAIAFQGLSTSWDQARTEENTENLLKYISKLSLLHFKTNTFPFQAALENYTDVECHLSSSGTIITLPLIPTSQQWLGCPCRVQGYTYLQRKPSLWCFTLIGTDKGDIRILGGPMFWKINPPSKNSKWRKMSAPGQKKSW